MGATLGYSADFVHIDSLLKRNWDSFSALRKEMDDFAPRDKSEFEEERRRQLDHYLAINPKENEEGVRKMVEQNVGFAAKPSTQFHNLFWDRFKGQYVTIVLMSSALCEAAINITLAAHFAQSGIPDVFSLIDKAEVKQKWMHGPKLISAQYSLPSGGPLYEALTKLVRQRNAFVHYKAEMSVGRMKVLSGSISERMTVEEEIVWVERFFSLPYDLCDYVRKHTAFKATLLGLMREKIPVATAHRNA
tara:strand:+ start:14377 stop:15117 length:741 start_codon:yes stop_codon:yes gene_type:complete